MAEQVRVRCPHCEKVFAVVPQAREDGRFWAQCAWCLRWVTALAAAKSESR